jgi:hypothetical protein
MKKLLLLWLMIISNLTVFGQFEIKTINRPDGVTMKYFNPIPVAINNSYEAGISLYKNTNEKSYLLAVTVLFKKNTPTVLDGNLVIQTIGNNGISLKPLMHKLINMNGRNVASSMYILTNRDIIELKSKLIKLVGFNINGQPVGLNLTKNKDILIKEFLGLN